MLNINLYITKQTVGSKCAGLVLLESNGYKKALAKCLSSTVHFNELFELAIEKLNQPSQVNLMTNCKAFEVNCAVMQENFKGKHKVFFLDKKGLEQIEWLKFVAYEIALNQGVDEFLLKEAMGEILV